MFLKTLMCELLGIRDCQECHYVGGLKLRLNRLPNFFGRNRTTSKTKKDVETIKAETKRRTELSSYEQSI